MNRRWVSRVAGVVAGAFLIANTASAYYYYTYFDSVGAPYTPIVARFDLNTLSQNTVPFFVSATGPSAMYPGDSFAALISQMSAAANVWNSVGSSNIRLAYGGFFSPGTTESAPGIQIDFSDDIPPGLLAFTIPTVVGNLASGPNGTTFLPIYLSLVEFPSDLSPASNTFNGPSYSEEFFITLVHEFGHSLGLQHTLASSVMSTITTSASTKASPLGADDIAGISLLYPSGNYLSTVGGVSGTVSMNGQGVNLASVVVISPSNPAISTLTNPDGTYQINGIPPGQYYVYVHPLPPPLEGESSPDNIYPPHNSAGTYFPPNTGFATQFYPNSLSPSSATQGSLITVKAGAVNPQINFNVTPLSSAGVSSVRTYSYVQDTYVFSAPVLLGGTTTIAAGGVGSAGLLQQNNALTPGLSVGMIGTAAEITNLRAYAAGNPYIAVNVMPSFTSRTGPMHLLFSTPGNVYVLPSGFSVVEAPPPLISALAPAGDGSGNLAIAGQQFTSSTQVWFDGVPATILSQKSNLLIVTPPFAPAGYTAAVTAFNSDGQSSLFLNPTANTYTYVSGPASTFAAGPASLVVRPSVIPSGGAVTVDVEGTNTNFQASTTVGFGTSDVQVNQINVISPTHMTVAVTPNVTISSANITITTGLEVISQAVGSPITTTNSPQ
jgi:hypothetical protein